MKHVVRMTKTYVLDVVIDGETNEKVFESITQYNSMLDQDEYKTNEEEKLKLLGITSVVEQAKAMSIIPIGTTEGLRLG